VCGGVGGESEGITDAWFRIRSSAFRYRGMKGRGVEVVATPGCDPKRSPREVLIRLLPQARKIEACNVARLISAGRGACGHPAAPTQYFPSMIEGADA
jgi:hypothetical protein